MKKLSYLLRHGAIKAGINMDTDGYVIVDDVLKFLNTDFSTIEKVVKEDNKNRYSLKEENGKFYIRANQGHSIQSIDSEELLTPITKPVYCFHATYKKNLENIKKEGLKPMSRKHVHFATKMSMVRKDANLFLELNLKNLLEDGYRFYMSDNNVILTESIIPFKYLKVIE